MKNYPTFKQYLKERGLLGADPGAIEVARKEYRKGYNREKRRELRLENREFTAAFSPEEFEILQAAAGQHGISISKMLHDAALAYLTKTFLIPGREQMAAVFLNLSGVYDLLREREERFDEGRFLELSQLILDIEEQIEESFSSPPELEIVLVDRINSDSAFRNRLIELINAHGH
ncbi:MAG: hypothetical protein H6581_19975 [Bacteroidia bacterium]|nr:hypothetical protein [Bacteroidia bacterium]